MEETKIQQNEDKVKAFLSILESIDNESSLKEMLNAFEMFMEIAKETRDMTEEEIKNLRSMYVEARDELKNTSLERFETLKARLISQVTEKLATVKDGYTPKKGIDYTDGRDADEEVIVDKVLSRIPPVEVEPETPDGIKDKLLEAGLEIEDVNKLPERLKELESRGQTRVGGGSKGIQLYVEGVKKGLAQYIDIVAGSNVTVSDNLVNGLHTITIALTGGSGFTQLSATETPDGSRTQFTFATASAQPSFIVMDNVWMKPTTATGGINWTWNGGTKVATMSVPAVDDIWGVV